MIITTTTITVVLPPSSSSSGTGVGTTIGVGAAIDVGTGVAVSPCTPNEFVRVFDIPGAEAVTEYICDCEVLLAEVLKVTFHVLEV